MTFLHQGKKINIKGDPSLIKSQVSLKNMIKTLGEYDEVVECRAIKFEGMTMAVFYEVDEVYAIEEFVSAVQDKFVDVFDWSKKLPRRRSIEHTYT